MFKRSSTPTASQRAMRFATGSALAFATILLGFSPAAAATNSGTQLMTGTSAPTGVLSITAPGTLTLPELVAGKSTAAIDLGSLSWTDTIAAATAWSVTLASTDLFNSAAAGSYIPFTAFAITVGQPIGDALNGNGVVTAGTSSNLTGTEATPVVGSVFSGLLTLAGGDALAKGSWTQANKITVGVPGNTQPGTIFNATIQYTVTG